MDEEELELGGASPLSLLGGVNYGTEESHNFAKRFLERYESDLDDGEDPEREIVERMRQRSDKVVQAIQATREKIRAQRYNPGELLLAASQALGAPTRTGTIGETIGNVFGNLRDPLARRGEFERGRDDRMFELDTQEAAAHDNVDTAEFQLSQLDRKLRTDMAGRSLTALSRPLRGAGSGGAGNVAKQREIASNYALLLQAGLDNETAWARANKLAYDNIRLVFDPNLGTLREVDMLLGEGREIPMTSPTGQGGGAGPAGSPPGTAVSPADAGQGAPLEPPGAVATIGPEPMTLWGAADQGTGWWSGLSQLGNVVRGNLGMGIDEEVADARSTLYKSTQPMIRALTLNDQFPVREIERLRTEMDTLPSYASNPAMLKRSLVTLRRYAEDALVKAREDWRNVNHPSPLRRARGAMADALEDFLPVLGVPDYEMLEYTDSAFLEPEDLPGFNELSPEEQEELRALREELLQ